MTRRTFKLTTPAMMLCLSLTFASTAFANPTGSTATRMIAMPDSVLSQVKTSTLVGPMSPDTELFVSIAIQPTDQAGLQEFADDVSDPSSPIFRHFLTTTQVAARFFGGTTRTNEVVRFAKSNNLSISYVSPNGSAVILKGSVAQIEKAFNTKIANFKGLDPDNKPINFHANTSPIMIPVGLKNIVLAVIDMDNYSRPKPMNILTPSMARTLYGTAPSYNNGIQGQGISIGISNWDGFKISNANYFGSYFGLPAPSQGRGSNIHVVSFGGGDPYNNQNGEGEGDLDLQQELSAAPLANIYIYDNGQGSEYPTIAREAGDNTCNIISESYGWNGYVGNVNAANAIHNEHLTMTTQGQTYCCASGDSGTSSMSNYQYPDVDPEVLTVGGTDATTNSAGVRTHEIGWAGSGGGWSTSTFGSPNFNVLPSWQVGTTVPTGINHRLVPDIGLQAYDNQGAFYTYLDGGFYGLDGTSCASPYFTGSLATLEQRLAAAGQTARLGRVANIIYAENGRSDVWYDVTSSDGSSGRLPDGTSANAKAGWDYETGFGAPNFDTWFNVLAVQAFGPTGFSYGPGILVGGNLQSLQSDDSNYLQFHPGITLNRSIAPIQVIVTATSPSSTSSSMTFKVIAHTDEVIKQRIELYNFSTNSWVVESDANSTTSDSTVTINPSNPGQFIQSGTNEVEARISYYAPSIVAHFPYLSSINQVSWTVAP